MYKKKYFKHNHSLSLFVMETAENMQTYNGVAILKPIETLY